MSIAYVFDFLKKQHIEISEEISSLAIVSLLDIRGSAPQKVGAKMITDGQHIFFGTVGGGKLEAYLLRTAADLLQQNPSVSQKAITMYKINLQQDIGMSCGGEVIASIEIEKRYKKHTLYLFGAGHVAQSFVKIFMPLEDWSIQVFDPREDWLRKMPKDSSSFSKHILDYSQEQLVSEVLKDCQPQDAIVSLSMGHQYDYAILSAAVKMPAFFIGVMGSKIKWKKLEQELNFPQNITCPLGNLKLDNHNPYTISLGLTVQILEHLKTQTSHRNSSEFFE